MLAAGRLKPWRFDVWLHPRTPRDAPFAAQVRAVADGPTRPLGAHKVVLSLDEMTSLRPRPRRMATRPARPNRPIQVEHEYGRAGATHRFAAFDAHTGRVYGITTPEHLTLTIPASATTIHLLADSVSVHHGSLVQRWLAAHPRFVAHVAPVRRSWMNPLEQWFGIRRRRRPHSPTFADLAPLQRAILQFITQRNELAHPFRWTATSSEAILAKVGAALAAEAVALATTV